MRFLFCILTLLTSFGARADGPRDFDEVGALIDRLAAAERVNQQLSNAGKPTPSTPRAAATCPIQVPLARASMEEHQLWERSGYTQASALEMDLRSCSTLAQRATHEFDVSAMVFRESGWDPESVRRAMPLVSDLFGQCGVRIGKVKLVVSNPAYRALDFNDEDSTDNRQAKAVPTWAPKPRMFFGRSHPKADKRAYAYHRSDCGRGPLCDTAFFTNRVIASGHRYLRNDPVAWAIAHELGHILTDDGHAVNADSNLMQIDTKRLGNALTPAQCQAIRTNHLVRPIAR